MGLRKAHLEYFFEMFKLAGYEKFDGLKVCELGNQRIKKGGMEYLKSIGIPEYSTSKELFTDLGFQHTSIDINGKDGALPINLNKPIFDINLLSNFDVITNSGTTEHVHNQLECFRNVHELCKKGGLFIHIVPSIHYRTIDLRTKIETTHGRYNYDFAFFHALSSMCGYKILDERIIRGSISVAMQKTTDLPFALSGTLPIYIVDGSG